MGRIEKLIHISEITKELRLVSESFVDYVTIDGEIYTNYGNQMYFKKSNHVNNRNGYVYVSIRCKDNIIRRRRLHRIIAIEWVHNDDPENNLVVGHYDNNKQNNDISNLYWTTNQENTQKAVDDGLNNQPEGFHNKNSIPVGVYTLDNELVAVYGAMRECEKYIENIDLTYLLKMLPKELNYKPRNKNYKYKAITKQEYINCDDSLKNIPLKEKIKKSKTPKVFEATNMNTGEIIISDNQKQFGKKYGLEQACISHAVLRNGTCGEWKFRLIKEINYKDSSAYDNLIELSKKPIVQNINTGEVIEFNTQRDLMDYFGLNGHSGAIQYYQNGQLIHSKWKVIDMVS